MLKAKLEAAMAIANTGNETSAAILKIPETKLQKDESDEAWYNNKLYDVVKREKNGDTVYVYLLRDNEEQSVLADNSNYFRNDSCIFSGSGYKENTLKKAPCITDNSYITSSIKKISFHNCISDPATVKNKYYVISFCTDVPTPPPRNA